MRAKSVRLSVCWGGGGAAALIPARLCFAPATLPPLLVPKMRLLLLLLSMLPISITNKEQMEKWGERRRLQEADCAGDTCTHEAGDECNFRALHVADIC